MISPFKFLDSYTKNDRAIFFGREREIEELYHRVFESKILLVYGVSGTGKSSLINCGLANKFQETDWLPLEIRRGNNIIESFSSVVRSASVTGQPAEIYTPAQFRKSVRSLYLDNYKPIYFIFDQFEELFIFGARNERKEFIQIIRTLMDSEIQCRFIFIMREEYMAGITEFEKFIPTFFSNRIRIEKMSHLNAIEAISGPCKVFDINLEDGFAETLLEKLSPGSKDVELTYLQVYLDKIHRSSGIDSLGIAGRRQKVFTKSMLEQAGNVSDLLGSFLDEQISLMSDPEMSMSLLKGFVSGKGTKRPANEQEANESIRSFGKELPSEKINELIHLFVKLRILRDKDDNGRYELMHDSLAEKVFEKFTTTEKDLLEVKQFLENAFQSFLKRGILLSNDDLNYISNKDKLLNLDNDLVRMLENSRNQLKAKSKTVRRLIYISGFAFLILLSTIVYYLIRKTRISESVFLKESMSQYSRPIDLLCLAGASWKSYQGEEAKEALLESFNNLIRNPGNNEDFIKLGLKYLPEFRHTSSQIEYASCSEDSRFIYGCTSDSVFILNRNGSLFSDFSHGNSQIISLLMNNDGSSIGCVCSDSMLKVWDNKGNTRFVRKIKYNPVNKDQIFRFAGNNMIIAVSLENDADLIDINGNIKQSFNLHKGAVNAVDISKDGKFIATASSDNTINIWYHNSVDNRFDLYNVITSHTDSVLSVDFAPNCRHLISASADKSVVVSSINNKPSMTFTERFDGPYNFNATFLDFPVFVEFDESGTGIVIRSSEKKNKTDALYCTAIYVDIYYNLVKSGNTNRFSYIVYSPKNKYLVYSKDNEIFLISQRIFRHTVYPIFNNYRLLRLKGEHPFFSPDGRYIYTINTKSIESWFIDLDTISSIATDYYMKWNTYLD